MATLVALFGLVAALVYNTIGVRQQVGQARLASEQAKLATEQARENRQNTQISLLAQLNALAGEADRQISATRLPEARCRGGREASIAEQAAISAAAQYYDFLAWLFNERHVTMESAKRYWTAPMLEAHDLAATFLGLDTANTRYPELARFKHALDHPRPPTC
jgi:hypothetical protein